MAENRDSTSLDGHSMRKLGNSRVNRCVIVGHRLESVTLEKVRHEDAHSQLVPTASGADAALGL
jgi:hypothetical protein